MRKSVKMAMAFLALAGLTGSVAYSKDGPRRMDGPRGGQGAYLERADSDDSGDISFEEFAAAMNDRMGFAEGDADADGKLTVEEIAAEMERRRHLRRAQRMVQRYDVDGDGSLALDEIRTHQREVFALMDRNDDGIVAADELSRRDGRGRHRPRRR